MRNFRDLEIWKRSFELVKDIYVMTTDLPAEERYGLRTQMNRAAVSIPSNIAEGCGRNSDVELNRFLLVAMGSAFELETQMLLAKELFDIRNVDKILVEINEIQRMINGYRKYLDLPKSYYPKS